MQRFLAPKKFEYSPLDPDGSEIRLLSSHPVTASTSIRCTLSKISLLDPPPYDALSYCWGASEPARYINCNGAEVKVTPSLYSALERMRQNGHVSLWVDAICINQDDNDEKGRQVPRIGTIFRMADRVVAWVGKPANSAEKVKVLVDALIYEETRGYRSAYGDDDQNDHGGSDGLDDSEGLEENVRASAADEIRSNLKELRVELKQEIHNLKDERLRHLRPGTLGKSALFECAIAVEKYLQRPYWRRMWIIQELALGQDITIYCGKDGITWQGLLTAVDFLRDEGVLSTKFSQSLYNIRTFYRDVSSNRPVNLLDALKRSTHALATNPRDKVYGILGLAYDASVYAPIPNYLQSILEMCIQMTKQAIRNLKSLDIVPLLGNARIAADMPSWLPPWTTLGDRNLGRQFDYLSGTASFSMTTWDYTTSRSRKVQSRCQAAKSTKPALKYLEGTLRTAACFLDTINRVSGTLREGSVPMFGENSGISPQRSAKLRTTASDDRQTFIAIWLLFTYRRPDNIQFDFVEDIESLTELWTKPSFNYMETACPSLHKWLDQHQHFPIQNGIGLRKFLESMSWRHQDKMTDTLKARLKQFTNSLSDYQRRKLIDNLWGPLKDDLRLMVSSVDNRVGWVTSSARPGDLLYLLKGCSVVVVLRRRPGGGHTVVGDGFVQGVMSGELMGKYDVLRGKWEEIDIY